MTSYNKISLQILHLRFRSTISRVRHRCGRLWLLHTFLHLVQERLCIVNGGATEDDPDTGVVTVHLVHRDGLLVCCAPDHENDDVLRFVPERVFPEVGVLLFAEFPFDEIL